MLTQWAHIAHRVGFITHALNARPNACPSSFSFRRYHGILSSMSHIPEDAHQPNHPHPLLVGPRNKMRLVHLCLFLPPSLTLEMGRQGNLPSDLELSSRDLGHHLNPGLSESCNFNLQKHLLLVFQGFLSPSSRQSLVLFWPCLFLQRGNSKNNQKCCGTIPRLEHRFGHYFVPRFLNGRDSTQNDFMKCIFGLPGFSRNVRQVIMPRGDGRKVILPSQMSTAKAIESDPDFSHTRHFHNHFTSVLGHSRNDTVIDWQLQSLVCE